MKKIDISFTITAQVSQEIEVPDDTDVESFIAKLESGEYVPSMDIEPGKPTNVVTFEGKGATTKEKVIGKIISQTVDGDMTDFEEDADFAADEADSFPDLRIAAKDEQG